MQPLMREWAGVQRVFLLDFGLVCDIEEACGKTGIGAIFLRLASHQYFARDAYQVIRNALVGGGMKRPEADILMRQRFSEVALVQSVTLAVDILAALNEGVDLEKVAKAGDPAERIDLGRVLANFAQAGIGPDQVRAMRYADFVNLIRSLGNEAAPPSEEEYADMIRRHGEVHRG